VSEASEERAGELGRLLAFSDGVFAIVITLLVLEIAIPEDLPSHSIQTAIDQTGPTFVAWVVSFLLAGMHWVWHRDVFAQVRSASREVLWLNLLYLLPVCLIPFASSVLGRYDREPAALRLYGSVLIAASLARSVLLAYLVRHDEHLHEPVSTEGRRQLAALALVPVVVYAVAMVLAGLAPLVSLLVYLGVPVLYLATFTVLRRHARGDDATDLG